MKYKYYLSVIIIVSAILTQSCSDFLSVDKYFNDRQNLDKIFKSRDYTEQWLAEAYHQLLTHNLEIGHVRYNASNFADDATFNESLEYGSYAMLKSGSYTPDHYSGAWSQSYKGIRQASILIENVDINEEMTSDQIKDVKGQAYFVRGYLYWLLLRKYGPIPILPDKGLDYELSYDELSYPRNTYDECVEYISEQMLLAAEHLKNEKRDNQNAARPTRGSALAVRAKAYLYAASPLANGNTEMSDFVDHENKALISQTEDNAKWAKAAAAALDVIKLNLYKLHTAPKKDTGTPAYPATVTPPYHPIYSTKTWEQGGWSDIDPFESYRSLFSGDLYGSDNEELIFTRGDNQLDPEYGIISLTRHQMPRRQDGYNSHGITLKQCDAYAMNDGEPFNYEKRMSEINEDPNGKFVTQAEVNDKKYAPYILDGVWKEYVDREPRFYASVGFNGALWVGASSRSPEYREQRAWYFRGELEGRNSTERWQPTGIGMMKYVSPKDNYKDGTAYPKFDPAIRYADILLMYVEALNELQASYSISSWDGVETYQILRDEAEMKKYLSKIRIRAGIPDVDDITPGIYSDYNVLKTAIKKERQVELLAENQRYYDLRRWKDAPQEEGAPIYGLNTYITKSEQEYFYQRMKVPHLQTAFSKKMYFWPVTYRELKRNKRLTQAPGWQSYD